MCVSKTIWQLPCKLNLSSKIPLRSILNQGFNLLKNLPPFILTPVPSRFDVKRDLESGRHFNSLRTENSVDSAGVTSLSFMLLHDTTLSL